MSPILSNKCNMLFWFLEDIDTCCVQTILPWVGNYNTISIFFQVAKRCNNTLSLRAICHVQSPGLQDGNICVTVDAMNGSVSMKTTPNPDNPVCEIDEPVVDVETGDIDMGTTAMAEAMSSEQEETCMQSPVTLETADVVEETIKPYEDEDDDCFIVEVVEKDKVKKR